MGHYCPTLNNRGISNQKNYKPVGFVLCMGMKIKKLADSIFNYKIYTKYRFEHYYLQISYILELNPKTILEVGPGDNTVTDFLRRKGFLVKTFDNDPSLKPDYLGDVRRLNIEKSFDLVLASEILEHMDFKYFEPTVKKIRQHAKNYAIISLPYTTIRLFPQKIQNKKLLAYGGRILSCEGRLHTFIPFKCIEPIYIFIRGMYRMIFLNQSKQQSFTPFVPIFHDNDFKNHHWDVGCLRTGRKRVRSAIQKHFTIIKEKVHYNTNSIFYILKK